MLKNIDETLVRDVIKKYSNFVGSAVNLNGTVTNSLKPVWLMDPKVNISAKVVKRLKKYEYGGKNNNWNFSIVG